MTDEIPGPAWIPAFLETLTETGVVGRAIKAARVSSRSVYYQRDHNLRFAAAWQVARPVKPVRRADEAEAEVPSARSSNWRVVFLEALAETSNVSTAAIRANVPLGTVYKVRRADAAFAANWQVALHEGYDMLEMELLGYLRDPNPQRKMDVTAALRLLAAHRDTVERRRALSAEADEQALLESIDRFIDDMRERRATNTAILIEAKTDDDAE